MAGNFQKDDTFVIGLTMAGAVSAGAYTAGVLDFLIEALDTWHRAKDDPAADVPRHNVCIAAITGTSAGGVCAPLLCAALAAGDAATIRRPAGLADAGTGKQLQIRNYLPRLYEAWVEKPSLLTDQNGRGFLGLGDLSGTAAIRSLLNSDLLQQIGAEALKLAPGGTAKTYPYISKRLHLFSMVGNARGVPYKIVFDHDQTYGMRQHAERIHVAIQGLSKPGPNGVTDMESLWAGQERPAITADAQTLFGATLDPKWAQVLETAMASCAFPAALRSRMLSFDHSLWNERLWPSGTGYVSGTTPPAAHAYPNVVPDWPKNAPADAWDYAFLNVDGGIANNEPFEYARYSIMAAPPAANASDGILTDRAVIMIDPFPEPPGFDLLEKPKDGLLDSVMLLPGVLLAQARFKAEELMRAMDEGVYTRYLIAPWGPTPDGAPVPGGTVNAHDSTAMSCGGLAGFSGFIEQTFRAHDFQLGRRNCQKFLRDHFCMPCEGDGQGIFARTTNAVIKKTWPAAKIADPNWFKNQDKNPGRFAQIVPLCGTLATNEEPQPSWPKTTEANLKKIEAQVETRLNKVVPMLLGELGVTGVWGTLLGLVWRFGKGAVVGKVVGTMRQSLTKRNQL